MIMKRENIVLLLLAVSFVSLNAIELNGTQWVNHRLAYLSFEDTTMFIAYMGYGDVYSYKISSDSLYCVQHYVPKGDILKHALGYGFIIQGRTADSMILRPFRPSGIQRRYNCEMPSLVDSNRSCTYYPPAHFRDPSVRAFEKIVFDNDARRYGHRYTIVIDKDRNYFFHGEGGLFRKGYYQGIMSDSLFGDMKDLLENSAVRHIRMEPTYDCVDSLEKASVCTVGTDNPQYTLSIYLQGDTIKMSGAIVPYPAFVMFMFLSESYHRVKLFNTKTAKKAFGR